MAPLTVLQGKNAEDRADLGRVARSGALNLGGAAYAGLAGFAVTWLVAQGLSPADTGAFFAVTSVFTVAFTVAKLGTTTGLVYWPAQLRGMGRPDLWGACLRAALAPVVTVSVIIAAGLWMTGRLGVFVVLLPLAALSDSLLAATRGCRQPRPTVLYEKILRPTLQLVALALALWLARGSTEVFTFAWAWAYLPVFLLAARAVGKTGGPVPVESRTESVTTRGDSAPPAIAGAFWRFTAPRALASVAQQCLSRVDVIALAALSGLSQAAYYAVAGRFVIVGQLANQALSNSVQPRLAELLAAGDRPASKALYQSATAWGILLSWPVYLLAAIFAPVYLHLFGPEYRAADGVVLILAGTMLVASGCGMVDSVLSMAGRTSWNLANVLLALAANVGVDLLLIPRLGAIGAACGFAVAVLTNNLVPLTQLHWGLRLHPFGRATLAAAALSVGCFGVIPAVVAAVGGRDLGPLLIAIVAGTACYGCGCWLLRGPLNLPTSLRGALRRSKVSRSSTEAFPTGPR